jgi:hypothetical protein
VIGYVARGVARFLEQPQTAMQDMRASTPTLWTALCALTAATLVLVVIDLIYGPLAFPHSVEPGGKRSLPVFSIAGIELTRAMGYAATVWLVARILGARIRLAEAMWMTVAYAIALILFELLQMGSWLLLLATGLNLYGQAVIIGFGATLLVLVVAVRALLPQHDWLSCLFVAVAVFALGYFLPFFVIIVSGVFAVFERARDTG